MLVFAMLSLVASLAAASPTPPPDLHIEGAGNIFSGGEGGPPAVITIVGFVVSNRGKKAHEIRVTGLDLLADGLPSQPGLGAHKITALDGEVVDATFDANGVAVELTPNRRARKVEPLKLGAGESAHIDVTIDGFSTMESVVARVWLTVDGKKSAVDLPLDVRLRLPLRHDDP